MLAGHRRPFLIHCFLDVLPHDRAHPGLLPFGEARIQEYDGAQCAGLPIDRRLRLTNVVPDLDCEKIDD